MCSKPVVILGNGGHAKVLIDLLLLQKKDIVGYSAPAEENNPYQLPYIGDDHDVVHKFNPEDIQLVNAIGSVTNTNTRKRIFNFFKSKGYSFLTVVHPSAVISPNAKLKEGAQIMAGAVVQASCLIGENTIVNTKASIDHDCKIGNHVHLAPGVTLSGSVWIGDETHVGTGATVIQNIRIGNHCLIGAGSLVIRDIGDNKKAFGVPAREMR